MRTHLTIRILGTVGIALLLTAVGSSDPASAVVRQSGSGGSASGTTNGHGVVVGVDNAASPAASGSGASNWRCTYREARGLASLPPGAGPTLRRGQLRAGVTYWRRCEHLTTHQVTWKRFTAVEPLPTTPARAERNAPAPSIQMSPDPSTGAVLGVATWLWVDNFAPTEPLFLSNGSVSVLARLFPKLVIWDLDDAPGGDLSDVVRCDGAGVPWSTTTPVATACTYSFRHRGAHHVTATIWWSVMYFDSVTSQLRELDPVTSSATVDIAAVQLDTVIRGD